MKLNGFTISMNIRRNIFLLTIIFALQVIAFLIYGAYPIDRYKCDFTSREANEIRIDEQQMVDYYLAQSQIRKTLLANYIWEDLGNFYNILVPEVVCPLPMRVGRVLDGGKWICNPFRLPITDCVIYSLGINNEYSFEMDIYRLSNNRCKIYAFDSNAQTPTTMNGFSSMNATFMQKTIGTTIDPTKNETTLQSIMQQYGQINRTVDMLKIDIEGSPTLFINLCLKVNTAYLYTTM